MRHTNEDTNTANAITKIADPYVQAYAKAELNKNKKKRSFTTTFKSQHTASL